jgi:hypothetical protein
MLLRLLAGTSVAPIYPRRNRWPTTQFAVDRRHIEPEMLGFNVIRPVPVDLAV